MNGEEAKKRLEIWLKCGECPEDKRCYDSHLHSTCEYTDYCDDVSIGESIKVAIKALEQEPCEDAISRQAVLDVTWEEPSYTDALNVLTEVRDKVKALPPVNPQKPKTGHWIPSHIPESILDECSECGFSCGAFTFNYCPNCGAKMG